MSTRVQPPTGPAIVREQVDSVLRDFLHQKATQAQGRGLPPEVAEVLGDFLAAGGKKLRPLLCVTGWQAAGGTGDLAPVLRVGAALEMFHAFCLIHDDIMDNSATRRGRPTVHRALAALYAPGRRGPLANRMGSNTAILIGDLALTWSDELVHTAGLTASRLASVLPLLDTMRTEVMYGQYLDVCATGTPTADLARALAIIRYKTAKYTVERPLHIGAALVAAPESVHAALSAYALPIGEAFQLRDDLLGVFGDPAATGKPSLDDLREGKHTALVGLALQRADAIEQHLLQTRIGDPGLDEPTAARIRRTLTTTGARGTVEQMIMDRYEQAQRALEQVPFPPQAVAALRELADLAVKRSA
ncbi:polyprenyl synthetase family protein [Streptomyces qinzhouensis]|uniref:Polyprenyl synthetase family protein n=1 Tax=Streptomyces qinzhouensis TaxID=2599401 RepID=A0A5B8IRX8_9ACTN|nr:polyprenyl synthetase family protein [Streptomyces qinzhouensis]QDY80399.1 polyprenyl synthetase family protein [Streptomyces qinzhouensis]